MRLPGGFNGNVGPISGEEGAMVWERSSAENFREFVVNKPIPWAPAHPNLRTGSQFRESLRDNRQVILNGRDVGDVKP